MLDLLEKDRDRLITELTRAGVPERASAVLETELDKLLLKYNEQAGSDKERDAAAYMMTAVRHALPLIDSVGDAKVWEMQNPDRKKRLISPIALIMLIAGIVLSLLVFVFANGIVSIGGTEGAGAGKLFNLGEINLAKPVNYMLLGSVACFIIFGFTRKIGTGGKGSRKQQVEIKVDPDKIYRNLRTAILSMDQSLEEIQSAERWAKREQAGSIEGKPLAAGEIDLFADLLTAGYSKDGEYALDKIEDLKYYLHKQQIEVLDYSEEAKQYFDLMPGKEGGTIRPALVADGKVLKKGLASRGK